MEENNNSMVLDIINDLVRMRQNLDFMDDSVKGVPQLKNRIKSIYGTLSSHQFEIPDLIGKSYHEGDNMIVRTTLICSPRPIELNELSSQWYPIKEK